MNVFWKVTLQSLKKNKTRTLVTIIGIILSAAMICAVTTIVSSLQNYMYQIMVASEGNWHGSALNADADTFADIRDAGEVSDAVYAAQIGYAAVDSSLHDKPYLFLLGANESFADTMSVRLTAGRFPQTDREILLPSHLATRGGIYHAIGDVLTLELGDRVSDGFSLTQQNPFVEVLTDEGELLPDETLVVRETRTYTVVGFYERPSFEASSAPGFTAITRWDGTPVPGDGARYDVYFRMNQPKEVFDFMSSNHLGGSTNTDVLMCLGVVRYDSFYHVLFGLAAIVILLIMFGSVSLIYNAFSISVSERTKQFGLLSSVGATRKQLRHMVFMEAAAVSAVGIPLGLLSGIGGIAVTLWIIGNRFSGLFGTDIALRVCVSPISVAIACGVALITVLLSAWIPSRRATKVTAMEAIRQTADIKLDKKTSKAGAGWVYRLFGLPGVLADKHYRRNRKKYRTTVLSLFMSIVLFISTFALTGYLTDSADVIWNINQYDLSLRISDENLERVDSETLLKEIRRTEGVTDAAFVRSYYLQAFVDESGLSCFSVQGRRNLWEEDGKWNVDLWVYFVSDDAYAEFLDQHRLSRAEYWNPDRPLGIALDGVTMFDSGEEKYMEIQFLAGDDCEVNSTLLKTPEGYRFQETVEQDGVKLWRYESLADSGDSLLLTEQEAYATYSFKSGKTIRSSDLPYYIVGKGVLTILYPESALNRVLAGADQLLHSSSYVGEFYLTSSDHSVSNTAMKDLLSKYGIPSGNLNDYAKSVESTRNLMTVLQVFAYGFIVLISLIATANVFNTISTNLNLRRREFAMLKSVGMTRKGFRRMMNFECLLYGSKSLLLGLPVSVGVVWLIWRSVTAGYSMPFQLPWMAIGIAVLSVFAVVFTTMLYSMAKIHRDRRSVAEVLKDETL